MATTPSSSDMQRFFEPGRHAAEAMIDYTEKLTQLNLKRTQQYTDLAVRQCRSMLEVRDTESLQRFVKQQGEVAREFGEAITEDTKNLGELRRSLTANLEQVSKESTDVAKEAAESTVNQATQVSGQRRRA